MSKVVDVTYTVGLFFHVLVFIFNFRVKVYCNNNVDSENSVLS